MEYEYHLELIKFIKMVKMQGLQLGNKYQVVVSKKRHQYSETECGMYCLYFIIGMLTGRNYKHFYSGKITDRSMLKLRNKYFNQNLKDWLCTIDIDVSAIG